MPQGGTAATGDNSFGPHNNDITHNSNFHPFISIPRPQIVHNLTLDPSHQLTQDRVQYSTCIQIFLVTPIEGAGETTPFVDVATRTLVKKVFRAGSVKT